MCSLYTVVLTVQTAPQLRSENGLSVGNRWFLRAWNPSARGRHLLSLVAFAAVAVAAEQLAVFREGGAAFAPWGYVAGFHAVELRVKLVGLVLLGFCQRGCSHFTSILPVRFPCQCASFPWI